MSTHTIELHVETTTSRSTSTTHQLSNLLSSMGLGPSRSRTGRLVMVVTGAVGGSTAVTVIADAPVVTTVELVESEGLERMSMTRRFIPELKKGRAICVKRRVGLSVSWLCLTMHSC